jgi:regulator of sirC expression with transglutaminase-like and TPR domain
MDPFGRFAEMVVQPDHLIPLDEAALLIAAHAYPDLHVTSQQEVLDHLAAGVQEPTVDAWRRHLFLDQGFAGNVIDYYDPRNSFLNDVLERRTGIPITLAVVGIEVGRRAGVSMCGVGMPGHFLLRDRDDPDVFVDPFDGLPIDRAGCEGLYQRVAGEDAVFDPSFLEPVGKRAILARMLANLKMVYAQRRDFASLAWVLRLRLTVPGTPVAERRELSAVLASAGRYDEAAGELDALADAVPDEAEELSRRALGLRSRLN